MSQSVIGCLEGKVVLVTGGARGLGAAIAEVFATQGATVVLGDLRPADDGSAASSHMFLELDVTDEASIRAAVDAVVARFGRLDVVVANAGVVPPWSQTADIDLVEWDRVMAINARGVLATIKHTTAELAKTRGSVVVMGSINSMVAHPRQLIYTASKHAVLGILRAAALDLGAKHVRVNGVAPGPIATDALLGRIRDRARSGPSETEAMKALEGQAALGRLATAAEVANTVAFLASDAASGITGQLLRVDAGLA